MLRQTIQYRTVQPRDSGRLEPTESRGGGLSIPNHNYTIFPFPDKVDSLELRHMRFDLIYVYKLLVVVGNFKVNSAFYPSGIGK